MMIQNAVFPSPSISLSAPVADQRITVTTAVISLAAFNSSTNLVVLDVQLADVMCTFDGSNPSSTNGHRLYAGSHFTWSKATATAAKFILQSGTQDAEIQASEFQV